MELFEKIKTYVANRELKKELGEVQRGKRNISIDNAKNIGILYSIPDEETYNVIFNFMKSLKTESRSVIALGFINEKMTPTYLNQGVYNSIINQKDLNWYGRPVNQYVKNFFHEKFDIFLNISLEEYFPLIYISALSNASFKVGKFSEKCTKYYDLMIKPEENTSQQEFIDEIIHYIREINQLNNE
ncbi:MAG: hypothetical protein NTU44_19860 [Bacteroidetes bacterium]|nr:hypothetical protein [Bacteroidota bacterium]